MLAFLPKGLDSDVTVTFHTRLFTYSMGRRIKRLLTPILQTKRDKVSRGPLQTSACKSKPMVWHLQIKEGLLSVGCIGDRGAPDMLRDITQVKQYVPTCQLSQYTYRQEAWPGSELHAWTYFQQYIHGGPYYCMHYNNYWDVQLPSSLYILIGDHQLWQAGVIWSTKERYVICFFVFWL